MAGKMSVIAVAAANDQAEEAKKPMIVRVWAFALGAQIDTRKVSEVRYLDKHATWARDARAGEVKGMADADGAIAFAVREFGAESGCVVAFLPVPDQGRAVTGINFKPQIVVVP